ncbi:hypothetical protein SAMN05421787_104190 [Virgibacillus pantothenticus]|nr:hypothetical protein SAMN05421787_104190 [Virgibacillus pantothenticus]
MRCSILKGVMFYACSIKTNKHKQNGGTVGINGIRFPPNHEMFKIQ